MSSWLPVPQDSHFPIANLPFGIISTTSNSDPRPAVAIGDYAIDLQAFASAGGFESVPEIQLHLSAFFATSLNKFAALGRPFHRLVRKHLQRVLRSDTDLPSLLRDDKTRRDLVVIPRSDAINHLPLEIGDYTDFYAGKNHAYNVGVLFRGEKNALQPNYTHIPIAYHGRASSVVLSGTSIRRPWGQVLKDGAPAFQRCEKLDFELEMGMFVCRENHLGEPIPISMAEDYIFGYVLLNDWSARDIQAWEYVPLGPFTSKNLGTSISPWVVLADTLEQARQSGLPMTNPVFPYLEDDEGATIPIVELEVEIQTAGGNRTILAKTSTKELLWSWRQMIAHHTITGCPLRVGDLFGSGTISGASIQSEGSLLERTKNGTQPLVLAGGETMRFLRDGDTIIIKGHANVEGSIIGFGEVSGTIKPSLDSPHVE